MRKGKANQQQREEDYNGSLISNRIVILLLSTPFFIGNTILPVKFLIIAKAIIIRSLWSRVFALIYTGTGEETSFAKFDDRTCYFVGA